MSAPYKVVAGTGHDVGSAQIVDRTTSERIGYVLADYYGRWHAWLVGAYAPLVVERYRRDAAAAIWDAHEYNRAALADGRVAS